MAASLREVISDAIFFFVLCVNLRKILAPGVVFGMLRYFEP